MGKTKKVFKKILIGTKKGLKEGQRAVKKYGPGVHKGLGTVASSIQSGFLPSQTMMEKGKMFLYKKLPEKDYDIYLKFSKTGKKTLVKVKKKRKLKMGIRI